MEVRCRNRIRYGYVFFSQHPTIVANKHCSRISRAEHGANLSDFFPPRASSAVDVPLCKELGIAVTNLPGFNAEAVAELTLSLALSVARRTVEFDRRLRAGETIPSAYNMGLSLFGKTVGL